MLILLFVAAAATGPISKFTPDNVKATYVSEATAGDIERCLLDRPGLPIPEVYRQPDRPNRSMIIWKTANGVASTRVDLDSQSKGTMVTSWMDGLALTQCAPGNRSTRP